MGRVTHEGTERDQAGQRRNQRTASADVHAHQKRCALLGEAGQQNRAGHVTDELARDCAEDQSILCEKCAEQFPHRLDPAHIAGEDEKEHKYFNISISKHIDPNYVLDDEIRITMHKEISKIKSRDQIKSLITEYTDRYGTLNQYILLYMETKYLEYLF